MNYPMLAIVVSLSLVTVSGNAAEGSADGQGVSAGDSSGAGVGPAKTDAADTQSAETEDAQKQAADGETNQDQAALTVEEILKRDPQLSEYVEEDRCISAHRIRNVEVIDQRHVSIRVGSKEYYLVQFDRPCRDLRRNRPVFLERNTSRLCKMDRLWGSREVGLGRFEKGMVCHIPGFQSVTKEQIVLLKDALKAERRKKS